MADRYQHSVNFLVLSLLGALIDTHPDRKKLMGAYTAHSKVFIDMLRQQGKDADFIKEVTDLMEHQLTGLLYPGVPSEP